MIASQTTSIAIVVDGPFVPAGSGRALKRLTETRLIPGIPVEKSGQHDARTILRKSWLGELAGWRTAMNIDNTRSGLPNRILVTTNSEEGYAGMCAALDELCEQFAELMPA